MTRIKQAGPPVLIVAVTAGLIGYVIGCTREQRDRNAQAVAQESATADAGDDETDNGKGMTVQDGEKADPSTNAQRPATALPAPSPVEVTMARAEIRLRWRLLSKHTAPKLLE